MARRRRILVALEPAVLEGAFALLLEDGTRNDVVQMRHATEDDLADAYDAAIVTVELLEHVRADVVVSLPRGDSEAGIGSVTTGDGDRPVVVRSHRQVIDLLDEEFETALASGGPRLGRR